MECAVDGNLPLELLLDILLRLQVKFLCRCKCVSKKWCSLIESPSFVKQHFEQGRNRERLLIRIWERNHEGHDVNREPNQNGEEVSEEPDEEGDEDALYIEDGEYKCALYVDDALSEYEFPSHLQMRDEVTDLFGPLNGVFCMATDCGRGPMALLNPALRQLKPLPWVQQYPKNPGIFHIELGLGFDPLTGYYKLVMLQYFWDIRSGEHHYVAYVCTSDSSSWRLLEDVNPIISSRRLCRSFGVTYLNGVYYWLFNFFDTTNVSMLAFDMMTEKFQEIPVMGSVSKFKTVDLALCADTLALVMADETDRCIDVWMMVNEGCWTRKSRVGPLDHFSFPLYLWKNDELLLRRVTRLDATTEFVTLCCNSTQESKILVAQNAAKRASCHWVFVYNESLVSIKGGEAGKCKLWDPSSDFIKNFFQDSSSAWNS